MRYGDTIIVIVASGCAVKESRDRVMTALINSGSFHLWRTTINLLPPT